VRGGPLSEIMVEARRVGLLAGLLAGCLNPRPEELPSYGDNANNSPTPTATDGPAGRPTPATPGQGGGNAGPIVPGESLAPPAAVPGDASNFGSLDAGVPLDGGAADAGAAPPGAGSGDPLTGE
jgi:hypothetical protein